MPTLNVVYALFGGICAGKTAVAHILERTCGATVVSKDRFILQSDRLARHGTAVDLHRLRAECIQAHHTGAIVLDETIRAGAFVEFLDRGWPIVGVRLSAPLAIRLKRLDDRIAHQAEILRRLSAIVGFDVSRYERTERRAFWRSPELVARVPAEQRGDFEALLDRIYLSGSHYMKPDVPDPLEFPELTYVSEFDEHDPLEGISRDEIENRRIPFARYQQERLGRSIKCCIWDIGGVLYDFSLAPFEQFTRDRMRDPAQYETARARFSFGLYMRGRATFEELVRAYADRFGVDLSPDLPSGIEAALRKGVGPSRPLCRTVMQELHAAGVRNVILSNALPVLLDTGDYQVQVAPEDRFYSFDSGYLKPERQAYEHVLDAVGVKAQDALFIDDKPRNVVAAEQLGICGVVFDEHTFVETLRRKTGYLIGA